MSRHKPVQQNVELWLPCGHAVTIPLYKTYNLTHRAIIQKADFPDCCAHGKRLPKWELHLQGYVTQKMYEKLMQIDLLDPVEPT